MAAFYDLVRVSLSKTILNPTKRTMWDGVNCPPTEYGSVYVLYIRFLLVGDRQCRRQCHVVIKSRLL